MDTLRLTKWKTSMSLWRWFVLLFVKTSPSICQLALLFWMPSDPHWCFYNLPEQFNWLLWFITFITKGIHYFVKKYTFKRVSVYIVFIVTVSFGFVYLLDCSLFRANRLFEMGIKQKLDQSLIELIPPILSDDDLPQKWNLYETQTKYRYKGESATFTCISNMRFKAEALPFLDQVQWIHDNEPISKKSRYNINTKFKRMPSIDALFNYEIKSIIYIDRVDQFDYGKYFCNMKHAALSMQESKHQSFSYAMLADKYSAKHSFYKTCKFELVSIPPREIHVQAPPGVIMAIYGIHRECEDSEIMMMHTINGMDHSMVCTGIFGGCSKFVYFYTMFHYGKFLSMPNYSEYVGPDHNNFVGTTLQCVCFKTYGRHEISFLRHYYNSTSKRKELLEETQAITYLVTPKAQTIFPARDNETITDYVFSMGRDCWRNDSETHSNVCKLVKKVAESETNYLSNYENVIFFLLLVILVLPYLIIILCYCLLLNQWIIPIRNLILEGSLNQRVKSTVSAKKKTVIKYDVYISHCNTEDEIAQELTTKLESSGFSVFCTSSILPGDYIYTAMAEAISESRKMIVLLSPAYLSIGSSCYEYNQLLHTVCEDINIRDILVLKCQPCDLPIELRRSYCCLDWPTDSVNINRWISGIPKQNILMTMLTNIYQKLKICLPVTK